MRTVVNLAAINKLSDYTFMDTLYRPSRKYVELSQDLPEFARDVIGREWEFRMT